MIPIPSAATSSRPVAALASNRRTREIRSSPAPKPSATASAASCGETPHGTATTRPGNVAVPTAWV